MTSVFLLILMCNKASSTTFGFIRRNLQCTPVHLRRDAYTALVRSKLEYATTVWDPYSQGDIYRIEKFRRQAARFITNEQT